MTNTLTISRELAENIADYMEGSASGTVLLWRRKLLEALAAPAVERQADAELLVEFFEHGPMATINWFTPSSFEHGATKVYIAPTSQVAVVLPEQIELVAQTIYQQWADRAGFVRWVPRGNSIMQDEARSIARACLDKVKEMNR